MTVLLISLGVILVIAIALISFIVKSYNKLVNAKELVSNSRGQIASQIESRWDALSNLISATQKYESHESETLNKIVNARSSITSNAEVSELESSEQEFQGSLSRLIAIAEAYPDLKASDVYKKTMDSVDKYEKNVRLSRMSYNDTVTKYNRLVITIPTNIVAGFTGHSKEKYFETDKEKESMPEW